MRFVVWFLPALAWAFTGDMVFRARRHRPAAVRRVLYEHGVWRYYYLLLAGLFLVLVVVTLVAAFREAIDHAIALLLFYSALAFLLIDIRRCSGFLISPDGIFRYPYIIRWEDVAEIRDTRWSLSLRLRGRRRVSIPRWQYRVSNEDVQVIRQLAAEPSGASDASQEAGGREVPWFEATVTVVSRILMMVSGLFALVYLLYWLFNKILVALR
jgi:hypothetical protein